ncbi:MAG: DUF3644 domain-containing protein, partial [Candidatus Aenigmarchaeota archaeon]|nr:DUF3644 domain-containing protein [Candidatus Aenigmarchaeota archaeon]
MKRLTKILLDKSQEAFILSLEIYNKPTIKYRIEGFCFFFCNAWELLLKAKILDDEKKDSSIYYKKQRNQKKRSLSLRDCLKKVMPNEKDPVRKNVEDIAVIRDEATHLIIKELEMVYSGLFQSGVLNYVRKLDEWFSISITEKISPAMLSLVSDIKQINPIIIKKRYGVETLRFIESEMKRLEKNEKEMNDLAYRIPIEYKLVLTKSSKNADITLSSGVGGKTFGLIEVPKDIERTHPYLQKDIIVRIKKKVGDSIIFNQYDFQAILYKEKIKGNYKYHYMIK